MTLTGKKVRLSRLSRARDERLLLVPLDHSVSDGPISSASGFTDLVRDIADGGADGIIVHKGRARLIPPHLLKECSLLVHLSASTAHAADANAKVLVGDVEEALRLGADAVSVHVNIGSDTEAEQLEGLGSVADACDRWGMPLLAMMYPRGPRIGDPAKPELLAHVTNIAADLGADLVKTVLANPAERMADVINASPLPVIVAGGKAEAGATLHQLTSAALAAGCSGVAVGRRIFTSPSPRQAVSELAMLIHDWDIPGPGPESARQVKFAYQQTGDAP
jgi:2-amino-4,5-dihydroxy-6-oxo-7-(phosphonooxy)heptanoate synthase